MAKKAPPVSSVPFIEKLKALKNKAATDDPTANVDLQKLFSEMQTDVPLVEASSADIEALAIDLLHLFPDQ